MFDFLKGNRKISGRKMCKRVNSSLGFARAGVPVNKRTCFIFWSRGVMNSVLLAKAFFK